VPQERAKAIQWRRKVEGKVRISSVLVEPAVGPRDETLEEACRLRLAREGLQFHQVGRGPLVEVIKAFRLVERRTAVGLVVLQPQQLRQFVPVAPLPGDELFHIENHAGSMGEGSAERKSGLGMIPKLLLLLLLLLKTERPSTSAE
jgi:hypothetical protein